MIGQGDCLTSARKLFLTGKERSPREALLVDCRWGVVALKKYQACWFLHQKHFSRPFPGTVYVKYESVWVCSTFIEVAGKPAGLAAGWMTQIAGGRTTTAPPRPLLVSPDKDAVGRRQLKAWLTSCGSDFSRSQRCGSSQAGVQAAQGALQGPLDRGTWKGAEGTVVEKKEPLKPAKRWAVACLAQFCNLPVL